MTRDAKTWAQYRKTDMREYIKGLRRALALTQYEFADRLGVRSETVHRWEAGKNKPDPPYLQRLRALERIID